MSAAYVSVRVAENTRHSAHLHVSGTGVLDAWVYIGEGNDVALWGSPAALRRWRPRWSSRPRRRTSCSRPATTRTCAMARWCMLPVGRAGAEGGERGRDGDR